MTKWLFTLLMGFCVVLSGCKDKNSSSKTDKEDVLTVGVSLDYPPFAYYENNQPTGLEVDLITIIAKKLGKKLVIKDMPFDSLIAALHSANLNANEPSPHRMTGATQKIDLSISAISHTPQRAKAVDFSDFYHTSYTVVVFKKDGNLKIDLDAEILKDSTAFKSHKIGVQAGTTYEQYMQGLLETDGARVDNLNFDLISLPKVPELIQSLKNNQIDGLVLGAQEGKHITAMVQGLRMVSLGSHTRINYAIVFPKGSPYRRKINKILETLKTDGTLNQLEQRYMAP